MIFCFKHTEITYRRSYLFVTYNESTALYKASGKDSFGGNTMFNFSLRSREDVKEFIERNYFFWGLILDQTKEEDFLVN